jgi:hypothetical protein
MPNKMLPPELLKVRERAMRALAPVKPADATTEAEPHFLFNAKRTDAGHLLPPYYLVYFLLVDLLGFKNLGQFEKISWSVPVEFNGRAFLIEHRKMGLGIFVQDPARDEESAREIVIRIQKAVKAAQPFFDWLADQAIASSTLNVINNSSELYDRYCYFRDTYQLKIDEATRREDERVVQEGTTPNGGTWKQISFPASRIRDEASWLAISAVEAYFSWTEHILIHLAILTGRIRNASEVTSVAEADWAVKFKTALDISNSANKAHFDRLLALRRELRNYVAHGSFGKEGEAFSFHSGAGAVPVLLPHRAGTRKFKIGSGLAFNALEALNALENFRKHLWAGSREPAMIYIQQSQLPIILTMATNGTYANAMKSVADMKQFIEYLSEEFDRSANMDW